MYDPWPLVVGLVLLIPIVAIVGGIGHEVIKSFFRHQERKAEIKAQSAGRGPESVRGEIEALRQEVARLRDTSTQYDISIQHTLEDLERRMQSVETRRHPNDALVADDNKNAAVAQRLG